MKFYDHSEVELVQDLATDEMVARAAWVSTKGDKSRTVDTDSISGLIGYLMREGHGTPFEHNMFTFYVKTPFFVRTEFMRHRVGFSYNEESGRYKILEPHFYVIPEGRDLIQTGKPGHYEFGPGSDEQFALARLAEETNAEEAYARYEGQLDIGIAKEVARMVLPQNTMTSFYVTMNARSLMNFLQLRTEYPTATFPSHPQWEIQQVAEEIEIAFADRMPLTHSAFQKAGRVAP